MEEIIDMQMPVLLCAILLIVISIPLYFGKGSNMIAGYNDLSRVDKEKKIMQGVGNDTLYNCYHFNVRSLFYY